MSAVNTLFSRLHLLASRLRREEGQGFTEYAVLLTVIIAIGLAVATTGIATTIGNKISSIINGI
jgi:Flp pilus assembly pilin Flp